MRYLLIFLTFLFLGCVTAQEPVTTLTNKNLNSVSPTIPANGDAKIPYLQSNNKFGSTTFNLIWDNVFLPNKLNPIFANYYTKYQVDNALNGKLSVSQLATALQPGVMTKAQVQELANHSSILGTGALASIIPGGTFQKLTSNKVVNSLVELESALIDSCAAIRSLTQSEFIQQENADGLNNPFALTSTTLVMSNLAGHEYDASQLNVYPPFYPKEFSIYRSPSWKGTLNVLCDGQIQRLQSFFDANQQSLSGDVELDSTIASIHYKLIGNDYYIKSYTLAGKYVDSTLIKPHSLSLANLPAMPVSMQDAVLMWDETNGWTPTMVDVNSNNEIQTIGINGNTLTLSKGGGSVQIPTDGLVSSVAGRTGAITLVKSDVGLSVVDNTSDLNKPISTATATALAGKEATITAGITTQYWRGDKTWQTLNATAVGLGNVNNTSDAAKPISTATQAALDLKANASAVVNYTAGTGISIAAGVITSTVAGAPSVTGHASEILTNDGTNTYWTSPSILGYQNTDLNLVITNNSINLATPPTLANHAAASTLAVGRLYIVLDGSGNKQIFIK